MTVAMHIDITDERTSKAGHKRLMTRINIITAGRLRRRLARKFQRNSDTSPGGGYGYEKRTAKYQRKKAKLFKHQKPNVFAGHLEQKVLSTRKTVANSKKAAVRFRMTQAKGRRRFDAARKIELTAVSDRELKQDRKFYQTEYNRLAGDSRYMRKRRKRV